jgi:hypothetical protein
MRLAGSSPLSLALAFGMIRGSHSIPLACSDLAGSLASSTVTVEALPPWKLRK